MKPTFKIIAVLFCLHFSLRASAQISKKDFAGIWQFTKFGTDSARLGESARGVLKICTDSTFTVVRWTTDGAFLTQSGSFKVPDKIFYIQKLLYQLPSLGTDGVGQETKIYYKFSPDKKSMTVSYALGDGSGVGYEVWQKL